MTRWSERTGLPYIIADATRTATTGNATIEYRFLLESMRDDTNCLGVNLCGGFVRNRTRKKGVYDEMENPDREAIQGFVETNRSITAWHTALVETKP